MRHISIPEFILWRAILDSVLIQDYEVNMTSLTLKLEIRQGGISALLQQAKRRMSLWSFTDNGWRGRVAKITNGGRDRTEEQCKKK